MPLHLHDSLSLGLLLLSVHRFKGRLCLWIELRSFCVDRIGMSFHMSLHIVESIERAIAKLAWEAIFLGVRTVGALVSFEMLLSLEHFATSWPKAGFVRRTLDTDVVGYHPGVDFAL
jgi:hypothetical protein